MSNPRGTDGSLLASLPWTLAALTISLVPHVPFLPIWITAAFLGCAGWRYIIERRRRTLPSRWLRAGLALACFLGVLATYSSISGVGPGSEVDEDAYRIDECDTEGDEYRSRRSPLLRIGIDPPDDGPEGKHIEDCEHLH